MKNKNENEQQIEFWGELKQTLENEGDGYFFYGYGLPSEYSEDTELLTLFSEAENSVNNFKNYIEQKIIDNGGDPEDWEM